MRSAEVSNAIDLNAAGSRTGGRISSQSSELDSPGIHSTVHSWDSHANYRGNYGHGDHRHGSSANTMPWPRSSHLIFYCDIQGHLKTATGLVRLLLLVSITLSSFTYLPLSPFLCLSPVSSNLLHKHVRRLLRVHARQVPPVLNVTTVLHIL